MNVVELKQPEWPVNETLVARLRELLADAEAGHILNLAFVAEMSGRRVCTYHNLNGGPPATRVIGALAVLQFELCSIAQADATRT